MKSILRSIILLFLVLCFLEACHTHQTDSLLDQFSISESLSVSETCHIDEDSIALVEGILCEDENVIIYDFHSGCCYTLFDKDSGNYITRFGAIGQGPTEIPSPCLGYLSKKCFAVFSDQARMIMQYSLDSLRSGVGSSFASCLAKYDIPDAQLSRLIVINDSTFLGAGAYRSRYQYVLFDNHNRVLDAKVDIYNSSDDNFNVYTKFLSNQGILIMHPDQHLFAYSLNFSSNMDFFKVENNQIHLVRSLRLGNPCYRSVADNNMFSADLTEESIIGYVDISPTSNYVYALYSDKKVYESARKSNVILVFDWKGNPVKKYILNVEVYYIAVDEEQHRIFAAVKNATNGWSIVTCGF